MEDVGQRGKIMVVDVSRTPSGRTAWGRSVCHPPEDVECLTASGPQLHGFSVGEGMGELSFDRALGAAEHGFLQGFPKAVVSVMCDSSSEHVCKRAFGNAMSIPVIGSVLARELRAIFSQNAPARYLPPSSRLASLSSSASSSSNALPGVAISPSSFSAVSGPGQRPGSVPLNQPSASSPAGSAIELLEPEQDLCVCVLFNFVSQL